MQLNLKRFMDSRRRVRILLAAKKLTKKQSQVAEESPHKIILVIAGNQKDYEHWLRMNKLSRHQYIYLAQPRQIRGLKWENTYLLRLDTWRFNYVVQSEDGRHVLNTNFPGWDV
jgi:hypothetical protein